MHIIHQNLKGQILCSVTPWKTSVWKGESTTAEADLEVVILLSLFFFNIMVIMKDTKEDQELSVQGIILRCRAGKGTLVKKSSNHTFLQMGDWSTGRLNDRSRFHPSLLSGSCYGFSQPLVPNFRGTKLSPHSLGVTDTGSIVSRVFWYKFHDRGVHGCTLAHVLR